MRFDDVFYMCKHCTVRCILISLCRLVRKIYTLGNDYLERLTGWKKSISAFWIILLLSTLLGCDGKYLCTMQDISWSPPSFCVGTPVCCELGLWYDWCATGFKHETYCWFKHTLILELSNFSNSFDWTVILLPIALFHNLFGRDCTKWLTCSSHRR
jgi:hypothetical protein